MKNNDASANSHGSEKEKKNSDTKKLADKIGPVNKNRFPKEQPVDSKKESFFNKADKKKNNSK